VERHENDVVEIAREAAARARGQVGECARLLLGPRPVAGEHFEEDDAERVDVAGRGDRRALELFGAGVFGREGQTGAARQGFAGIAVVFGQQLGDAEVEQFGSAVGSDEDVSGLEVAVHDEVAMGVGDGVADLVDQAAALLRAEAALVAKAVDGQAVDVIHGDPGAAVGSGSGVEQAGDGGVLKRGKDALLAAQALDDGGGVHAALDDLDGDALLEFAVGARGEVDDGHAAAPDLALQTIWPEHAAGRRLVFENAGGAGVDGVEEGRLLGGVVAQQGEDFFAKLGIVGALPAQEERPLAGRQFGGGEKEGFDLGPAVGR